MEHLRLQVVSCYESVTVVCPVWETQKGPPLNSKGTRIPQMNSRATKNLRGTSIPSPLQTVRERQQKA